MALLPQRTVACINIRRFSPKGWDTVAQGKGEARRPGLTNTGNAA
jgi:hypothetical protein